MTPGLPPSRQPGSSPAAGGKEVTGLRRWLRHLPHAMGLVLMVAAIIVVQREMRHLHWADIRHALAGIPAATLWAGAGMTVLSYVVLSFYDWLAVRQIGRTMPFRRTAFAAFCSYVLSHNLGFSAISGAAVRFRLYGNWGLRPVSYTHLRAHETTLHRVCRLLLEKKLSIDDAEVQRYEHDAALQTCLVRNQPRLDYFLMIRRPPRSTLDSFLMIRRPPRSTLD